jgi:hypothetical protein
MLNSAGSPLQLVLVAVATALFVIRAFRNTEHVDLGWGGLAFLGVSLLVQ